jgi:hypothetical protein
MVSTSMVTLLAEMVTLLEVWVQVLETTSWRMHGKTVYIRPKVVEPFPGLCVSENYVHRAALYGIY